MWLLLAAVQVFRCRTGARVVRCGSRRVSGTNDPETCLMGAMRQVLEVQV
jgi:hypothetical protein